MENCIFCKIIEKQIPSAVVWENSEYLAILDINPNVKGATLVLPKKHVTADFMQVEDTTLAQSFATAKTVAKSLKDKLEADRIAIIVEGLMVDHFHIKLYPIFGLEKYTSNESKPHVPEVFYDTYPGFVTSELGPRVSGEALEALAKEITKTA